MKRDRNRPVDPDMLPEYDFKNAVRGKYAGRFTKNSRVFLVPDKPIAPMAERREKRVHWVLAGDYAVEVEIEIAYTAEGKFEPCLEPKTLRFLDEVARRAEEGDLAYLRKVGRVFQAVDKAAKLPSAPRSTVARKSLVRATRTKVQEMREKMDEPKEAIRAEEASATRR